MRVTFDFFGLPEEEGVGVEVRLALAIDAIGDVKFELDPSSANPSLKKGDQIH